MVTLGREGAFGPFSPLPVLCIVLGRWCLAGVALAGGSPRPVGAWRLWRVRLVWMWGRGGPLWAACQTGHSKTALGCVLFCALLCLGWGRNHCFNLCCAHRMLLLHPALEQRPPGAGTRDSGSRDISTGLLWLAPNCSKIHSRNFLGEEGNIFFPSIFFFFSEIQSEVPLQHSLPLADPRETGSASTSPGRVGTASAGCSAWQHWDMNWE